mmetsp:Transcript_8095/g.18927  ORF Transcript_8095/g.18927 Transcript_8095/m.18927 type:complete len:228 (-) Transcript_8095:348-1031(-)
MRTRLSPPCAAPRLPPSREQVPQRVRRLPNLVAQRERHRAVELAPESIRVVDVVEPHGVRVPQAQLLLERRQGLTASMAGPLGVAGEEHPALESPPVQQRVVGPPEAVLRADVRHRGVAVVPRPRRERRPRPRPRPPLPPQDEGRRRYEAPGVAARAAEQLAAEAAVVTPVYNGVEPALAGGAPVRARVGPPLRREAGRGVVEVGTAGRRRRRGGDRRRELAREGRD